MKRLSGLCAILCVGISGCSESKPNDTTSDAVGADSGCVEQCSSDASICITCPSCENWALPGPAPSPWWLTSPPAACTEHPSHSPMQLYDDCTPSGGHPQFWGPRTVGSLGCTGSGRWTQSCLSNADCPSSMVCYSQDGAVGDVPPGGEAGRCEKSCTGSDPGECIRCDLGCHPELKVCQPKELLPKSCRSDCECGGKVCIDGHCVTSGVPSDTRDYCNPSGASLPFPTCPCTGGSCRPDACCELPDGTIANSSDPACAPE